MEKYRGMMKMSSSTETHQVFLNYRGEELRYSFVSHLIDAFERRGIDFFVDKYEQRGKDLKNLFVRIQQSRIALAIFSTSSEAGFVKKIVKEVQRVVAAVGIDGKENDFANHFGEKRKKDCNCKCEQSIFKRCKNPKRCDISIVKLTLEVY
ncbi:unnamed protein product [Thlaspi arvense]|uniref:TIR domain-containing protein n=1 Tax=Thlaspi arvense TaxID=13288 RepID=A0AAU9RQA8_THLAR|nr:unnamed protein product [Thlaspi arvense]